MTKTVAEKLQIKPNTTVWVSDPARIALLTPLPDGVRESDQPATASVAVVFADDAAAVRAALEKLAADLTKPAAFWVAYPKGNKADINRDTLPDGRLTASSVRQPLNIHATVSQGGRDTRAGASRS